MKNMTTQIFRCTKCNGEPRLTMVGDNKEYLVYMCSKCYKTPVHIDEASLTPAHAVRTWNRRTYEALFID